MIITSKFVTVNSPQFSSSVPSPQLSAKSHTSFISTQACQYLQWDMWIKCIRSILVLFHNQASPRVDSGLCLYICLHLAGSTVKLFLLTVNHWEWEATALKIHLRLGWFAIITTQFWPIIIEMLFLFWPCLLPRLHQRSQSRKGLWNRLWSSLNVSQFQSPPENLFIKNWNNIENYISLLLPRIDNNWTTCPLHQNSCCTSTGFFCHCFRTTHLVWM